MQSLRPAVENIAKLIALWPTRAGGVPPCPSDDAGCV